MEILRVRHRLVHHFPEMSKPRLCKYDIFPDRARRRLFVDTAETVTRDYKVATTDADRPTRNVQNLEEKYTDITEFLNPPKPYRTVVPVNNRKRFRTEETNNVDGVTVDLSVPSERESGSQKGQTQPKIQEFFKSQKRRRVDPVHKTPDDSRISEKSKNIKSEKS